MIREPLCRRRFPVFFAAILAAVLFAAPPQASAEDMGLTAFTATAGDARVTLKWTASPSNTSGAEIRYRFVQWNTVDGSEVFGTCRTDECDRTGLVCQANWRKVGGESPPERRSNQTTFLREPCAGSREGAGEASVAVRVGRAIEHRKRDDPGCRGFQNGRRQHRRHRFGEMPASPAVSENPCTSARLLSGPWEVFKLPRLSCRGRIGNGECRSL